MSLRHIATAKALKNVSVLVLGYVICNGGARVCVCVCVSREATFPCVLNLGTWSKWVAMFVLQKFKVLENREN